MVEGYVTPLAGLITKLYFSFEGTDDELGRIIAYSITASMIGHKISTESEKHMRYEQMRLVYLGLEKTLESVAHGKYDEEMLMLRRIVTPFMTENTNLTLNLSDKYSSQPLLLDLITYLRESGKNWQDDLRMLGLSLRNNIKPGTNIKKNKENHHA
ncbi:MAG: hypothetical protein ABIJ34_01340, partial [archaeon]